MANAGCFRACVRLQLSHHASQLSPRDRESPCAIPRFAPLFTSRQRREFGALPSNRQHALHVMLSAEARSTPAAHSPSCRPPWLRSFCSPSVPLSPVQRPAFSEGPTRCPLKTTPAARLAARASPLKGERPNRTAERKKKTMKSQPQNHQTSGLLSRPEHISTAHRQQIDFSLRRRNRHLSTSRLIATLRIVHPQLYSLAEVVGKWVWISFAEKQPVTVTSALSELGFHWNKRRQTWQHPCNAHSKRSRLFEPRRIYRSYFPADAFPE